MYGTENPSERLPDLVMTDPETNFIYKCWFDPKKAKRDNTPLEDQEIWQIVCIRQWLQGDGAVVTKVVYPNGSMAHDFAPNKITEYQFKYRI